MPKKWFFVGIILVLWLMPVQAQVISNWQAWLFDSEHGQATLINNRGIVVRQVFLPVPSDDTYSYSSLAISHDGNVFAYSTTGRNNIAPRFNLYFVNRREVRENIYPFPFDPTTYIGQSLGWGNGRAAFSTDNQRLAFGMLGNQSWEIVVLDVNTGSPVARLRNTDPNIGAMPRGDTTDTPIVAWHEGTRLFISFVAFGTEAIPPYQSFIWDYGTNTVVQDARYQTFGSTFPPTREIATSALDRRFPNDANNRIYGYQTNTVQVVDSGGNIFPFVTDALGDFSNTALIQNGKLLFTTLTAPSGQHTIQIYERNRSQVLNANTPNRIFGATGVGDGVIYLTRDAISGTDDLALYYVDTTTTSWNPRPIYYAPDNANVRIVWVDDPLFRIPQSYIAWATLPPPTSIATPVSPAPPPTTGTLRVGGIAQIFTTEGDALNVRSGPATNFDVLTQFPSGTQVNVIEGPVESNGFTWWRVQAPDGQIGWVVQAADGVQTLIPIG